MYGATTPGGGGRTPMYGSQTPMYDAGSRTPHYGGMTPSHPSHEDGSRTPGMSLFISTVLRIKLCLQIWEKAMYLVMYDANLANFRVLLK